MSNRDRCRKEQWKKGIPSELFNKNMHYGDKSKIFHTKLSHLIDYIKNDYPPEWLDIKDYYRLVSDIKNFYYEYFNQHLSDLTPIPPIQNNKIKYADKSKIFHFELSEITDLSNYSDLKDYRSIIPQIEDTYEKHFQQQLSQLLIK